ncbi:outer membrane protein transport protein (OMPP1/FadL/TodX) [Winogradskyella pacifica]|uniref:Outer membrane protein transport protein (OMPP1/FadL/TodX) n=1 Tax=Winogradskyella pacifica TaxID=664642 RepID=A0A3D9MYN4_9FLAO|nr:outer membrane protein transport protein [Winogradskyella pacifica]REE24238.1 outer membrane protein transport protein (OMPP1/FadL/TodX) [Winogradskyella pacifica]
MKKLLMLSISLLSTSYILAQDITDALRYSMDEIQGTARYRAMGGAFGALGGDMSSININPAGSAVFNNSHGSISLGLLNTNNDVSYFNGMNSSSNSNVDLNQLGAAFIFKNTNGNSGWNKFALSFAYDRSADFDNDWVANGVNPNRTIGDYFLSNAQGLRLDEISALPGESISEAYSEIGSFYGYRNQQAFLGYEGFIIDPSNNADENTEYVTNINGGNYNQRYAYSSRGYNGKLAFNVATSYNDRLYFGLNLNSHFINYERTTLLNESNSNASSLVNRVDFENNLLTTGSGFSFQLGGIAKITEELRVGLSYNSPTWYRISDETSQYLATSRLEGGSNLSQVVNPNVINIYEEYKLQTPGKVTGSLAYVFGKTGLLSFDYAVKDYSNSKFKPTTEALFSSLNNSISNNLDSAVSYRLGGEYRFKQISFRGGYRFEESPYKNDNFYGDLNGYSLGLGYSFGNLNIDFAFSQSERDYNYQLYTEGLTDTAQIESKLTDFVLTLGFNL